MLLDSSMLLSFVVLMSWRLSGVTAHEWIGLGVIALIFAHLIVHWSWVETTVALALRHERKGRVGPLLVNATLFISMGTALISGVVISKVVLPNRLLPGEYLQWHSLHETSATVALVVVGLHVALNWDRIRGGIRRLLAAAQCPVRAGTRSWRPRPAVILRRGLAILALTGALIAAVWAKTRFVPSHPQVLMMFPDGHTELTTPPADITQIHAGSTRPDPAAGGPRFMLALVALGVAALAGRFVLRLRLDPPRVRPDHQRTAESTSAVN